MKHTLLISSLSFSLTVMPALSATDQTVTMTCASAKTSEQKQKLCDAAKDAHGAENASKASSYIWGGVAAVCAVSVFKPGGAALCNKVNTGGGVADAVVKKDYANMLTTATIGQNDVTKLFGGKKETTEKTATSGEVGKTGEGAKTAEGAKAGDKAAAPQAEKGGLSAAMVAMQATERAMQNKNNAQTAGGIVDDLAENQKDLDTDPSSVTVPTTAGAGTGGNTTIVNQYSGNGGNNSGRNGSTSMMGGCSDSSLASLSAAYNCARGRGADLPPPGAVSEINDQLKQLTGKDIADYMKSGTDPFGMVNDALKNTSPEKSKDLKDALASTYSGGATNSNSGESLKFGANTAPAAASTDDDLSLKNMLQDLMAAQGGAVGPDGQPLGEMAEEDLGDELSIEIANRKIASELVDGYLLGEKENLFDRVHKRYSKLSRRDQIGGTNGQYQKN